MKKTKVIVGLVGMIATSVVAIGEDTINGEIVKSDYNTYKEASGKVADGEKSVVTGEGVETSVYKDGRLKKVVVRSGNEVISLTNYDEYGLKDGKAIVDGVEYNYVHGFLDGRAEPTARGNHYERTYSMGILNGETSSSNGVKGYYSYGMPVGDTEVRLWPILTRKKSGDIRVKEGVVEGYPKSIGNYTGSYYLVDSRNKKIVVYDYTDGKVERKIELNDKGIVVDEEYYSSEVYNKDNTPLITAKASYDDNGVLLGRYTNYQTGDPDQVVRRSDTPTGKIYAKIRSKRGIPHKEVVIVETGNDSEGIDVIRKEGYYSAGLYTGPSLSKKGNYIEKSKVLEDGMLPTTLEMPSNLRTLPIKRDGEVANLGMYSGYIVYKTGVDTRKVSSYDNGKLVEDRFFKKKDGLYEIDSKTYYSPSGKAITTKVRGGNGLFYTTSNVRGEDGYFTLPSKDGQTKWIGHMKDGKFIGKNALYESDEKTLIRNYNFYDGSKYKGALYKNGKVVSVFQGVRESGGLLVRTGQQVFYNENGEIEKVYIFNPGSGRRREVTVKVYRGNKVVETKRVEAIYGESGNEFNFLNEREDIIEFNYLNGTI